MKCYKNLFNIKNIKNSYGSLICLIIACIKSNKDLKKIIVNIFKAKEIFIFVKTII